MKIFAADIVIDTDPYFSKVVSDLFFTGSRLLGLGPRLITGRMGAGHVCLFQRDYVISRNG
jgi:hypothetical protein